MERMKDLTQQYVEQLNSIIKDLREEKFKLVEENERLKSDLEEENKKLNEKLEQAIYWKVDYEKSYKQADAKKDELLEENKNLKSDLAFERTMLDNVRAEYKSLQNVIKKLNEDVDYRHHRAMVAERGGEDED